MTTKHLDVLDIFYGWEKDHFDVNGTLLICCVCFCYMLDSVSGLSVTNLNVYCLT